MPISSRPRAESSHRRSSNSNTQNSMNLWKLLLIELNISPKSTSPLSEEEKPDQSLEQILNIARIPIHLEKFMLFGLLTCLNSFLTLFTILPLRLFINGLLFIRNFRYQFVNPGSQSIKVDELFKKDLITTCLIIISVSILFQKLDISRIYHDIRGQAAIKLYVMFGVLEVADKLCASLGQDVLNILLKIEFIDHNSKKISLRSVFQFVIFGIAAILYTTIHGFTLIYHTISLNVAVNSYSNALLTLLLSNQFAEIKTAVFKKFDREGLFQITCADLTERFQLFLMLFITVLRNLLQVNTVGLIPTSWSSWNRWVGAIFGPSIFVVGSEVLVDWLKHSYITKFNKIRPKIYEKFLYVLSLDFIDIFNKNDYNRFNKRIGLPLIASIVCFLRMALPDINLLFFNGLFNIISLILLLLSFLCLILIRLLIGLVLLKWANKIKHKQHVQHKREIDQDDFVPGIPNTSNSEITENVRHHLYDLNEKVPKSLEQARKDKTDNNLDKVMRYEMSSKRIW